MAIYTVDRFEGELAILLDDEGCSFTEPKASLPEGAKEGTVLRKTEQGYVADADEEAQRRDRVLSLQEKLRLKAQK